MNAYFSSTCTYPTYKSFEFLVDIKASSFHYSNINNCLKFNVNYNSSKLGRVYTLAYIDIIKIIMIITILAWVNSTNFIVWKQIWEEHHFVIWWFYIYFLWNCAPLRYGTGIIMHILIMHNDHLSKMCMLSNIIYKLFILNIWGVYTGAYIDIITIIMIVTVLA